MVRAFSLGLLMQLISSCFKNFSDSHFVNNLSYSKNVHDLSKLGFAGNWECKKSPNNQFLEKLISSNLIFR